MENVSATSNTIVLHEKIHQAANWHEEDQQWKDVTYVAFCRVMRLRREVAIRYDREVDMDKRRALLEIFERYNTMAKQVLGL